jgi:hypothetical protein
MELLDVRFQVCSKIFLEAMVKTVRLTVDGEETLILIVTGPPVEGFG